MKRFISVLSSLCLAATSLIGAMSGIPASAASLKVSAESIQYDLVPHGISDYTKATSADGNNAYSGAKANDTLTIDWVVHDDPGTAGLQAVFDFSAITKAGGKIIDANDDDSPYKAATQINTDNADKGEVKYAFGQATEEDPVDEGVLCTFVVQLPANAKEGDSYLITNQKGSKLKAIPKEQGVVYDTHLHGLLVSIGDAKDPVETDPPAKETDAPAKETDAPKQTDAPGEVVGDKDIVYDLVLAGEKATVAENTTGNNKGTVEPGKEFKVEWRVKHDPGTAGLQLVLDFADLVKAGGSFVDANDDDSPYKAATQINEENAAKGEVKYAFGQATEEDPVDDDVLCVFTFKAPTKNGTYTITNTGKLKAIPKEQGEEYSTLFHGLTITVGDAPTETDAPAKETDAPKQTDAPGEVVGDKDIVYDLVLAGEKATVAENTTGNNKGTVEPGKEFKVEWRVKHDPGTAGLQLVLDFADLVKAGGSFVDANDDDSPYKAATQINDENAAKGEVKYAFGQATEEDPVDDDVLCVFTFKAPTKEGTYTITNTGKLKAIPKEQGEEYSTLFHGLTITVGDAPTETEPPVSDETIIYNMVVGDNAPTVADTAKGNNTYTGKAGEAVVINWNVKNDPGTAGIQMNFDFSELIKAGGKYTGYSDDEGCYVAAAQFNDEKLADTGVAKYAFGQSQEEDPVTDATIASISFTLPADAKKGDKYVIQLYTGNDDEGNPVKNKVIPKDQGKEYNYVFHGLEITIGDETKETDAPPTPAGAANWVIGKKTVAAGAEAVVPVTVTKDDGTAGFVAEFTYNKDLTFKGIEATGEYSGDAKATVINPSDIKDDKNVVVVVWASDDGKDQKANDVILNLTFTAPTKAGTYEVEFAKNVEASNTDGEMLTVTTENGSVTVEGEAGKVNWTIATTNPPVAPGAKVALPVSVSGDTGTAGYVVEFTYDPKLTFEGVDVQGAYTGDAKATVINPSDIKDDKNVVVVVWSSDDGENQKGDGVVLNLNFTAPTEKGKYDVEFDGKVQASDSDGAWLEVTQENGAVIVGEAGKVNWTIATTNPPVAPGAKVALPVSVSGDTGTAGYVVEFTYDPKLTFEGVDVQGAYTGDAKATVINPDDGNKVVVVVWSSDDGENQKGDGVVLNLNFTAPEEPGKYDVEFDGKVQASDSDGAWLEVTQENGAVTVAAVETSTPAPADETTPAPADETTPAPAQDTTPAPSNETTPAPAQDTTPAPAQDTTPAPSNETTPAPAQDTTPAPAQDTTPAPSNETTPAPAQDTTPAPAQDTTPAPSNETTPAPAQDTTPAPSQNTTPAPAQDTTPAPSQGTTAPIVIPAGSVGWIIGTKVVAPGAAAKVPVTIKKDPGTAGFAVEFSYDPKLTFTGIELGDAYPGIAQATVNGNDLIVVWADDNGANQKAADDAVVIYLNFTAPQEEKEYPVTFKELTVSDTEGELINTITVDGAVVVKAKTETDAPADATTPAPSQDTTPAPSQDTTPAPAQDTTPAPAQDTTPAPAQVTTPAPAQVTTPAPAQDTTPAPAQDTTPAPAQVTTPAPSGETTPAPAVTTTAPSDIPDQPENPGHAVYQIDDVTGQSGKTVDVPVFVWFDEGTTGFTMQFKVPEGYKISGCKTGNAYVVTDNEYKWNPDDAVLVWAADSGEAQTAKPGATIAILQVDVPAGVADNTKVPVEFVNVTVSGANEEMLQHTEINGSITIKAVDGGDIVFNIGSNSGKAGETADVPLSIGFDKGVSSFELTLNVPDGVTIDDLKIDPDSEFYKNGTFEWDPETKTLKWTSNGGDVVVPPNTKIADISVKIPEGAEAGTVYPITGTATAKNADGNDMTPYVTDGKVTVDATPENLKVVTDVVLDYKEPTRVNYWSHDDRTFAESKGLADMKVMMTLKKYYVNADNQFVDADGNVISDTAYDAATGKIPEGVAAFSTEEMDVTQYCHPISTQIGDLAPENSPLQVWQNQLKAEYGDDYISAEDATTKELRDARLAQEENAKTLKNKHTLAMYYFSDENPNVDFRIADSSPYYLGDYNIYIGVKGDTSLDNKVSLNDAQIALKYYTQTMGQLANPYMVNDDEYGHKDELRFFLGNVRYAGVDGTKPEDPTKLSLDDAQAILLFYTRKMGQTEPTWEQVVGYDRLDTFYPGSKPE